MTPAEVEATEKLIADIQAEMEGRKRGFADVRGELLFRCADALSAQAAEIERMRKALERLRDCDWVITTLDRMDAVRNLARQALTGKDG